MIHICFNDKLPGGPGGPGGPSMIPLGNSFPSRVVVKPRSPLSPCKKKVN